MQFRFKYNDLDLSGKLRNMIVGVSGISMLLTTLGFGGLFLFEHRQSLLNHFTVLAQSLAANATAALTFEDADTAQRLLRGLQVDPDVVSASLYNADGSTLAQHLRDDHSVAAQTHAWASQAVQSQLVVHRFNGLLLEIAAPVQLDSKTIGAVHLQVSLINSLIRGAWLGVIAFLFLGLLLLLAYRSAHRLQHQITAPLEGLTRTMREITREQQFDLRVPGTNTEDEIGELISGFNDMIDQVQERDAKLLAYRQDLEHKVHERTAELEAARDAAEAGSRAKSEFLATMSHEIRTPMNGVLGMTELLLTSKLEARQQHLANTAYRSAETLLGVIDNILDFSKIEAGKLQLADEHFQLRSLLDDTLEMFADHAQSKGLELLPDFPPQLPDGLTGDSTRLRQILINLLGNAIKFTQEGEVRLNVRALQREDDQQWLHFAVIDTGIGVPQDQQAHLFDAFTQADSSSTRRFGGTGLGLAISRQLVELMGGTIRLQSIPGEGASFSFEIPLRVSPQRIEPAPIAALKDVRVLIVDDNSTNREILHNQIIDWGMRNGSVPDGEQALQRLRSAAAEGDPYKIALLDWHMPGMDGLELARTINNDPLIPPLHLIVLSSAGFDSDSAAARAAGIASYMSKPVRQDRLLETLRHVLGHSTQPSPQSAVQNVVNNIQGRVLLVEDNLVNQEVAVSMLEDLGCQVDLAGNGLEAVEAVTHADYALILMDCHMPELDGFGATERIRAWEGKPAGQRIPIVALTADVKKGVQEQCKEAGMDDYLSKPFSIDALQGMLEKWLGSEQTIEIDEPPTIVDDNGVLDQNHLRELDAVGRRRGTDTLGKVIDLYLQDSPALVQQLQAAAEQHDHEQVRQCAHGLKSSSANIGARALSESCARLETAGREGVAEVIPGLVEDMLEQFAEVRHLLGDMLRQRKRVVEPPRPQNTAGPRILLVDDDRSYRATTAEVLRAEGFQVIEAGNGNEALEKAAQRPPELILLDAIMHGMDGYTVCKRLQDDPQLKKVPVIMVTGLDDAESARLAFDAGATGFTSKPVNYAVLLQQLRFVLRARDNESLLRESENRLRAAQRLARLGYWRWHPGNASFELSEELARMLLTEPQQAPLSLEAFLEYVHPEDRARVGEHIRSAAGMRDSLSSDYRILLHDGSILHVRQDIESRAGNRAHNLILGTVQDISRQQAAEQQIRKMAYFDLLTGLASRSYLMQHLDDAVKSSKRRDDRFSLMFIDLDGFKDINDSLGHDVGDQLLSTIARRIKSALRETDFVARLGGDEFCVLVPDTPDNDAAARIASTCLDAIATPLELANRNIVPKASIGIANFPDDADSVHDLLKAADSAMYAAKTSGKHRYTFYDPDMTELAEQRLALEQELHQAVIERHFIVLYQPIISMRSGQLVGVEAQVRWQHPSRGLVPPDEFIPMLEQLNLIAPLCRHVIREVCFQMARWREEGLTDIWTAVNMSMAFLESDDSVAMVAREMREAGLPKGSLELELHESALLKSTLAPQRIAELKRIGVRIAIDDFSNGFAAISSLRTLPISTLKVGRQFVQNLHNNPQEAVLLGSAVGLAFTLGQKVVAVGADNNQQVRALAGLGCDLAQGDYFSPPITALQIPECAQRNFKSADASPRAKEQHP